jgi:hypothetical protein
VSESHLHSDQVNCWHYAGEIWTLLNVCSRFEKRFTEVSSDRTPRPRSPMSAIALFSRRQCQTIWCKLVYYRGPKQREVVNEDRNYPLKTKRLVFGTLRSARGVVAATWSMNDQKFQLMAEERMAEKEITEACAVDYQWLCGPMRRTKRDRDTSSSGTE